MIFQESIGTDSKPLSRVASCQMDRKPTRLAYHDRQCADPTNVALRFAPYPGSPEKDIRFVYCAFVISHLVGGENLLFRVEDAVKYVLKCRV